jgi:rubrerythrin
MGRSKPKSSGSKTGKPLSNLAYDVIAILHEKSQAIEAYDQYLEDAEENDDVREVLEEIRDQEEQAIHRLEQLLPQVLGGGSEEELESEEEEDESSSSGRRRGAA